MALLMQSFMSHSGKKLHLARRRQGINRRSGLAVGRGDHGGLAMSKRTKGALTSHCTTWLGSLPGRGIRQRAPEMGILSCQLLNRASKPGIFES